jgi:hypothetical protein
MIGKDNCHRREKTCRPALWEHLAILSACDQRIPLPGPLSCRSYGPTHTSLITDTQRAVGASSIPPKSRLRPEAPYAGFAEKASHRRWPPGAREPSPFT